MTAAARQRALLRHAVVAVVSTVVALGAAELCARVFAPDWLRARMREVAVGRSLADWSSDADWPVERDEGRPVRFVPNSRFTVRHEDLHTARIDEHGGRMSGRAADAGWPIVPVFGDSMTFGIGVRDEETFVSLVEPSLPVRLVNFAMPGSELLDPTRRASGERRESAFLWSFWGTISRMSELLPLTKKRGNLNRGRCPCRTTLRTIWVADATCA